MNGRNSQSVLYRETQRFRQVWLWLLLFSVSVFSVYSLVQQLVLGKPVGNNPASDAGLVILTVIFGLGFPVFFYLMKLTTEVRGDGLYFRYFPLHLSFRKIPWPQVKNYGVKDYRPIRDYGGWGIKRGPKGKAYNVSGSRGVHLELSDGRRLLIGSQKPEAMAAAMQLALQKRSR
jgi:hypothetical protein